MAKPFISILMATYNGEAYLQEQLQTLAEQSLSFSELLISDDGSSDRTLEILQDFKCANANRAVKIFNGPKKGASENFWSLFSHVSKQSDFVAFADQDDIWMPDKVSRAVAQLVKESGPALYGSRSIICTSDGKKAGKSFQLRRPPRFENALVQNVMSGNSMMMNRAGFEILKTSRGCGYIYDWYIYQLLSGAGAKIIHDPQPSLFYRQHAANQIGANSGLTARALRIVQVLDGSFSVWNQTNRAALWADRKLLTASAKQTLIGFFLLGHMNGQVAIRELKKLELFRQGLMGAIGLKITAFLGLL